MPKWRAASINQLNERSAIAALLMSEGIALKVCSAQIARLTSVWQHRRESQLPSDANLFDSNPRLFLVSNTRAIQPRMRGLMDDHGCNEFR
jgi:hypothetical protein